MAKLRLVGGHVLLWSKWRRPRCGLFRVYCFLSNILEGLSHALCAYMHILRCVCKHSSNGSVCNACVLFFLLLSISSRFLQTPSPCSMLQTRMTTMYKRQFYKSIQKKSQLCSLSRRCHDTSCWYTWDMSQLKWENLFFFLNLCIKHYLKVCCSCNFLLFVVALCNRF